MHPFLVRLALDESADERAIKRAYARELRQIDPEKDPAGFQQLHEAYQEALSWADECAGGCAEESSRGMHAPASASATASYKAPPDPAVRWPHLASAAPLLDFGNPEAQARSAYDGFMRHLAVQLKTNPRYNERSAVADLLAQLAADELVQLEASVAFEYLIALGLIEGWQAGNDLLLAAAIEVFAWERTRNRLREFNETGVAMMQAVGQWQAFRLMLAHSTRGIQVLLAKLRGGQPPSDDALRFYSALLKELKQQYPLLLPMLAPADKIERWLDTPLPMAWVPQRMIDLRDVRERPVPKWYPTWTSAYRKSLLGVAIAFLLLTVLYTDFIRKDQKEAAAQHRPGPTRLEDFKDVREALRAPPPREDAPDEKPDAAKPQTGNAH